MFNGMGLAITSQGDRLMVGALLGMPALGLYSVAVLVVYLPTGLIFKLIGTVNLAALHNASKENGQFESRLRFYATSIAIVAGGYAVGLLALMNTAISVVFGAKFVIDNWILVILALGSFFKIVRSEPFTSLLVHEMKTGSLTLTNQSTSIGLGVGTVLTIAYRTIVAPLIGRLLGEIFGLCSALYLTRHVFRPVLADYLISSSATLLVVLSACCMLLTTSIDLACASVSAIRRVRSLYHPLGWNGLAELISLGIWRRTCRTADSGDEIATLTPSEAAVNSFKGDFSCSRDAILHLARYAPRSVATRNEVEVTRCVLFTTVSWQCRSYSAPGQPIGATVSRTSLLFFLLHQAKKACPHQPSDA